MRIIVVGKRGGILHWFENVLDGFSDLHGHDVLPFCSNHSGWFDQLWKSTLKGFSREILDNLIAEQFLRTLRKFRPDLVLIVDWIHLPKAMLQSLAAGRDSFAVAWWIGDFFNRELCRSLDIADRYYFTDSYFIKYAAEGGLTNGSYLPLAYNPKIFRLQNRGKRKEELVFVGAYSSNRAEYFRQIRRKMTIVGKNWDNLSGTVHEIRACRINIEAVNSLYNEYVGVLNIKNSDNVVSGLNMRTFDAPACGCVVVNDYLEDLGRCFDVGKEILAYRDIAELHDQYDRIMNDVPFRESIVAAGRRRVESDHTYRHRLEKIVSDFRC